MKKENRIIAITILVILTSLLISSCMFVGDNFKIRKLISYIDSNKQGNEKVQVVNLYDDYEQKSVEILFVNVDTVIEADEIVRLINQYLADHPDYFLNDDYYIEVNMDYSTRSHTQNFMCRNSLEVYRIGDEKGEEYFDRTVSVEDNLCYLNVIGYFMDQEEMKLSRYAGLFPEIKNLTLQHTILDDLSVFGTMESIESVRILYDVGEISDELLAQLNELYPEIDFIS